MPVPRARTYRPTPRNLAFLAARLRAGELVAVPTETVYGLAGNAFDERACGAIFRAKGRPSTDPLIVHLHSWSQLDAICRPNDAARRLAQAFWPGPLTIILPKTDAISDRITAGKDSVAIRMPAHPVFRRLLKLAGVPLAAPSANPFGYISPTTAQHVAENLGGRIPYILDGGPSQIGVESTIIDLRAPARPQLLRPGAISAAQLARVLGVPVKAARPARPSAGAQVAPGLLLRHYSPRTPVVLHERIEAPDNPAEAYIYSRKPAAHQGANIFWLDPRGQLRGAARRLFAVLRLVDAKGFRKIHVEQATGGELAEAINDRFRRAAAR